MLATARALGLDALSEVTNDCTGYLVDVAIAAGAERGGGQCQDPGGGGAGLVNPGGHLIEVDGPYHFASNTRYPLGATRLKRKLLCLATRGAGARCACVPYWEWEALAPAMRADYLRRVLRLDRGLDARERWFVLKLFNNLMMRDTSATDLASATCTMRAGGSAQNDDMLLGSWASRAGVTEVSHNVVARAPLTQSKWVIHAPHHQAPLLVHGAAVVDDDERLLPAIIIRHDRLRLPPRRRFSGVPSSDTRVTFPPALALCASLSPCRGLHRRPSRRARAHRRLRRRRHPQPPAAAAGACTC